MLGGTRAEQYEFLAGSLRDLIPDEHVLARVVCVLDLWALPVAVLAQDRMVTEKQLKRLKGGFARLRTTCSRSQLPYVEFCAVHAC